MYIKLILHSERLHTLLASSQAVKVYIQHIIKCDLMSLRAFLK